MNDNNTKIVVQKLVSSFEEALVEKRKAPNLIILRLGAISMPKSKKGMIEILNM